MVETIADRVREILSEAVEHVSNGGTMKFDIRSLFYAVREIYLKRWSGEKFYEYNSFTQDFMRSYEKQHGKIKGLVRGPRGKYCVPDEYGWRTESDVKPDLYLMRGIGNKIIVVEKMGLFEQMLANNFDKRLDCILMTTQGFTSEAGREALLQVQEWGLPVCVLHDFDVNGILIKETLTKPTKRLDTEIDPEILVDVGLNWEVVGRLREERDLTPEPVSLSTQDKSKLLGMLQRREIERDEAEFLMYGRVELNALTPRELLDWLEQRLEALDLWKTVPTQEQLDELIKRSYVQKLAENLLSDVKERIGFYDVEELFSKLAEKITEKVRERLEDEEPPEPPTVEEFKDILRKRMEDYWTQIAQSIARAKADKFPKTDEKVDEIASKLEEIADKLREVQNLLNEITGGLDYG